MTAKDIAEYGEKIWALCKDVMTWGAAETGVPIGTVIIVVAIVAVAYLFLKLYWRSKR